MFFASRDDRELCRACNLPATKSNDKIEPGKECIKAIATQLSLASRRTPTSPSKLEKETPSIKGSPKTPYPLTERPSEFSPIKVHVSYSSQDFKEIKNDLVKFTDSSDKYVEVFQNLTQTFELDWTDVMLILNQTLTSTEQNAALQAAIAFEDEQMMADGETARGGEEVFPSGKQAVPTGALDGTMLTHWECGNRSTFGCTLEGLRRTRAKPLNYSELAQVI